MKTPQQTTPQTQQTPSGIAQLNENWIMKALGDIREDMKSQHEKIDNKIEELNTSNKVVEERIGSIESKITKLY